MADSQNIGQITAKTDTRQIASKVLIKQLEKVRNIEKDLPFKIKFAVSNFMGYGLYEQNVFGFEEFLQRFSKQIYST